MNTLRRVASLSTDIGLKERRRILRQASRTSLRYRCTMEVPPTERRMESSIPTGILGQATCHTHPHLIEPDFLTCGITQMEYKQRRDTLVNKLLAESHANIHKTHIIVIPGARKQYMSEKIPYVFRQNSDFFYLTGCLEPSSILVLLKPAHVNNYKSILFVSERDAHAELWEGPRTGCDVSKSLFAVDESRPVESFGHFLNKLTMQAKPSVLWYHNENPSNPDIHQTVRSNLRGDGNVCLEDPQRALHFMRVVKSPAEVELMKRVCLIGAQSINLTMACTKPGISEHQLNAILEYASKQGGAEHLAFPPVVAGGSRATHIHYVTNNQILKHDEMVLIDSGCQRWLYNSDISRTYPVSGRFNKYQRILYEIVLSVQKRLIHLLGEHRPPLDHLFDSMCRLLGTHLQQEGILQPNLDVHQLVSRAYRLCPHHVSHYLGLDVHDAALVRRNVNVADNMIVTVEPGIYIAPDDKTVPQEFRGIGIRIEDDVLITDGAPQVLTDACAKEVHDIESLVGSNLGH